MAPDDVFTNGATPQLQVGVYTKTIVPSSVVRWILHARVRNRRLNDVVFIGEDFIDVKQIEHGGHLRRIAIKTDFDSRIRAATTFRNEDDPEDLDFLVKLEREQHDRNAVGFDPTEIPPQSIVLTLESNNMVFCFLRLDEHGNFRFVHQAIPMPVFDRIMFQPGHHIAADPQSRALAVAANERDIVVYAVKPRSQVQHELRNGTTACCPVVKERRMQVDGVIQHLAFLHPPTDDSDHVILLAIVIDSRRTKAVRIEWNYSSGIMKAERHRPQALSSAKQVSSLLIPLQDAAFFLVTGNEASLWRGILSGSAHEVCLPLSDVPSKYPGSSSFEPLWTSWTRPARSQAFRHQKELLYMVREDGLVLQLEIPRAAAAFTQAIAGGFSCHVGTAFASLADESDPDVLCVGGDSSNGRIVSIGNWPTLRRIAEMTRTDAMTMEHVEAIPNWASTLDMLSTDSTYSSRTKIKEADTLLVTSGRQPFGTITELRKGIEARSLVDVQLEGLAAVTDTWVLPAQDGSLVMVLSSPVNTTLLLADAECRDVELATEPCAFELEQCTLAAATTTDSQLIQVTPRGICVTSSLEANFEDTFRHPMDEDTTIIASSIVSETSTVVNAEQSGQKYFIRSYSLPSIDDGRPVLRASQTPIPSQPLAVTAMSYHKAVVMATATIDGKVAIISMQDVSTQLTCSVKELPTAATEEMALCDSVLLLRDQDNLLLMCGLRDGRMVSYSVDANTHELCSDGEAFILGVSTVKLVPIASSRNSAIAMSGASTYLISWDHHLSIENVWVTDQAELEFSQGPLSACAQLPHASRLSAKTLAQSLLLISGDNIRIVKLDVDPSIVPRQIATSNTPTRLIYADSIRHLVTSGLRYGVRQFPGKSGSPPEERRHLWPTIDFIPIRGTKSVYTHHLQPGERVYALLQWTLHKAPDKTYAHILVGGSYISSRSHARKGKVTFLQPAMSSKYALREIREGRNDDIKFDGEVTAIALYDDLTFIACAGNEIHLRRLDLETKSWQPRCKPFRMASPGLNMTVRDGHIIIAQAQDSILILRLTSKPDSQIEVLTPIAMGPRADIMLTHLLVPIQTTDPSGDLITLASTKYNKLLGLSCPLSSESPTSANLSLLKSSTLLFEATLPHSLTKLVPSAPPTRKGPQPSGLLSSRIVASATEGAITALTMLSPLLWRRLFWLQRLIEWSPDLSPHSFRTPAYSFAEEERLVGSTRGLPIGCSQSKDIVPLCTPLGKAGDMHIDGDILKRVLSDGGVECVRGTLERLKDGEGVVGEWARANVEKEMEALEEIVEVVRKLDHWLG